MGPEELLEIDRFLLSTGKENLYDYLGTEPAASTEERETAITSKRKWAQGQQSNPKYKQEAVWFIRHLALCQEAVLHQADNYLAHVRAKEDAHKLESLSKFIAGVVSQGPIGVGGIQVILEHGLRVGLFVDQIQHLLARQMLEHGVERLSGHDPNFVNHYAELSVTRNATHAEIEHAYRTKYDEVRTQRDSSEATAAVRTLDQAWDILGTPHARTAFDELYDEQALAQQPTPTTGNTDQAVNSLLGMPGALHRAPGEEETEIAPASTDGISFAGSANFHSPKPPSSSITTTTLDPANQEETHSIRLSPILSGPESIRQAKIRHQAPPKGHKTGSQSKPEQVEPTGNPSKRIFLLLILATVAALWLIGK